MFASGRSNGSRYAHLEDLIAADEQDWPEPPKPKRDWKKILLVAGLGTLSWVATYVGMLELIQSNMGELSLLHKLVVGFSVAMLMTMIIWLLDQMFAPLPLATKTFYIVGYLFLTLISVGFGFGFYWKVLESRSEASRSATSAISQVQAALFAASSRLDQLQSTLGQLQRISTEKAVVEREKGTSCPNSRPGDGPRRKLRDADAARFSFASEFVKGRGTKVKDNIRALDVDLKKVTTGDPSTVDPATGTRNKFLQALTRKLELTATGFNAFRTDPQLRQIRSELAERSTQTVFPTGRGRQTFSCPDPQLQSALRGVVRAIDQLPELGKPQIATVEGAGAVVEAFRRLITTLYGAVLFKLPPSADELRALQQKAVQSVENAANRQAKLANVQGGLSKRDYIPLSIAMFVDVCLLLVSIGRPMNRLSNLIPKMREAEHGPVFQILSRFDEIHKDDEVRGKFEIFRHVVFDFNGDYYVAVPLDAPRRRNPEELEKLQLEAHLLGNLFASFEKERIFSRVHNPLLSRKTIEKKLERQGSKFAQSSAFRVYRFRNGAWSDIILGAVMGAAKRASVLRRRAALLRGPVLDMPADEPHATETTEPETPAPAARPDPIVVPAARANGAERPAVDPFDLDGYGQDNAGADASAAELRAKYGPYAASLASEMRPEMTPRKPDPARWPYRRKPKPIEEADVEVMPGEVYTDEAADAEAAHAAANNNTSPSRRRQAEDTSLTERLQQLTSPADTADEAGNVIPMPGPRLQALQTPSTASHANGGAIEGASGQAVQLELIPAADLPVQPFGDSPLPRVDVRLTERTADLSLPVGDAGLPAALLASLRASVPDQASIPGVNDDPMALAGLQNSDENDPSADCADTDPDRLSAMVPMKAGLGGLSRENSGDPDPMLRVAQRFARPGASDSKE
jgi:hypothetical protein